MLKNTISRVGDMTNREKWLLRKNRMKNVKKKDTEKIPTKSSLLVGAKLIFWRGEGDMIRLA